MYTDSNNKFVSNLFDLVEYVYYGGNEIDVLPPLIEYDEDGNYTKEILNIYGSEYNAK